MWRNWDVWVKLGLALRPAAKLPFPVVPGEMGVTLLACFSVVSASYKSSIGCFQLWSVAPIFKCDGIKVK